MLERKHNDPSKLFLQKLLSFIDATLNNTFTDDTKAKQVAISGLLNLKDAIFAELIRENTIIELIASQEQNLEHDKIEKKKDLDQEKDLEESEADQSE